MTSRIDAERILDAFLAPDADRLPNRVIEAALTDIARTPQRRAMRVPGRIPTMTSFAKLAIGAAVVVVVVVAGIQFLPRSGTSGRQPNPQAAPTATPAFAPLAEGPLAPGRYALYDRLATSIEVPAGWIGKPPFVRKVGADGAGLWWGPVGSGGRVFTNACTGPHLEPVDGTLRGLVHALDAQVGTNATITQVTLGGLPATRVDLVKDLASCSGGTDASLNIWSGTGGMTSLSPGARGIVYVLEKNSELWVFLGIDFNSTASDEAELERVIASTQFGP